jgi:cell division protein ZapA (FtsZ GTPase activity inhibitor)
MNRHTVYVAGKHFVLLSEDKDDYVQKLASEVNDAIKAITEKNPTLDRRGAAILCALDYADDKYKEIERSKSLATNAKPLIAQADRQSKQLKELKEKGFKKDDEIRSLKEQLKKKNEELKALSDQKKHLEKKLSERMPEASPKPAEPEEEKGYIPSRQISLFDNE